jgi:hypothetical protein
MELKYIDCPSNKIIFQGDSFSFHGFMRWDENTLIINTTGSVGIWDISNPLDLKKLGSLDNMDRAYSGLLRVGDLLYIYPKGDGLQDLSYSIADLSDTKNVKIIATHQINLPDEKFKRVCSMLMTPNGKLLAIISKRGLMQLEDNGEPTLIDEIDSEIGRTLPPADLVLLGNLLVIAACHSGVFLYNYNDAKLLLLKRIQGVPSHTPPPINLVLNNKYIVLTDNDNIQMIDIREPKKAKRLPKLKITSCNFIRENFLVEGDTMLNIKIKEKKDVCSLFSVRLLSEGPVLYEEIPVDITAWPRRYDYHYDVPQEFFKKDNYLLVFTSLRDLVVFEMIK